jgi:hypothetical protein
MVAAKAASAGSRSVCDFLLPHFLEVVVPYDGSEGRVGG